MAMQMYLSSMNTFRGYNVELYLGNGDGTFQSSVTCYSIDNSAAGDLLVTDLNHDGKLDLVLTSRLYTGSTLLHVVLGNGDGTFQLERVFDLQDPCPSPGSSELRWRISMAKATKT